MNSGQERGFNSYGDGGSWFRSSLIGKGSFGSVFMANLKNRKTKYSCLPRVFAVKSAEVSVSATLQKEKEVLLNVQGCRNVIQCFGEEITTSESGDMVYNLLLEYASGGTLTGLIKKSGGGVLPESNVRFYTRSILRGLNHIHERGYVHCDLKPENILLVPSATDSTVLVAKIADFGLSKRSTQSKTGRFNPYLRGSLPYMSPEVVTNGTQKPPSDIWALGCVVLEMLTGMQPWFTEKGLERKDLLRKIGNSLELPNIPSQLSQDARDFLKGCFVRRTTYRLTAEMLLNHSFVAGFDDESEEGAVDNYLEDSDAEDAVSMMGSSETDDELSSSFCSDDQSFTTEDDDNSSSFLLEEADEMSLQHEKHSILQDNNSSASLAQEVPKETGWHQPALGNRAEV